eukprot:PhM_4_TR1415/c0_g1_i1/m.15241
MVHVWLCLPRQGNSILHASHEPNVGARDALNGTSDAARGLHAHRGGPGASERTPASCRSRTCHCNGDDRNHVCAAGATATAQHPGCVGGRCLCLSRCKCNCGSDGDGRWPGAGRQVLPRGEPHVPDRCHHHAQDDEHRAVGSAGADARSNWGRHAEIPICARSACCGAIRHDVPAPPDNTRTGRRPSSNKNVCSVPTAEWHGQVPRDMCGHLGAVRCPRCICEYHAADNVDALRRGLLGLAWFRAVPVPSGWISARQPLSRDTPNPMSSSWLDRGHVCRCCDVLRRDARGLRRRDVLGAAVAGVSNRAGCRCVCLLWDAARGSHKSDDAAAAAGGPNPGGSNRTVGVSLVQRGLRRLFTCAEWRVG